jgi:hypothetical protein
MSTACYRWPAVGTEWEDAERDLLEALGKDANDADTLANLVTVSPYCLFDSSADASALCSANRLVWCRVSCFLQTQVWCCVVCVRL